MAWLQKKKKKWYALYYTLLHCQLLIVRLYIYDVTCMVRPNKDEKYQLKNIHIVVELLNSFSIVSNLWREYIYVLFRIISVLYHTIVCITN